MYQIAQWVSMIYMAVLSIVDINSRKIPFWGLMTGFAAAFTYRMMQGREGAVLALAGAGVGFIFLGISKMTGEAFGYADSLLVVILGIYLGFWELCRLLAISFFISAVFSIIMLSVKKMHKKTSCPFIPFLALGYLLMLLPGGVA